MHQFLVACVGHDFGVQLAYHSTPAVYARAAVALAEKEGGQESPPWLVRLIDGPALLSSAAATWRQKQRRRRSSGERQAVGGRRLST
jgi:hypothetical protein